MAFHKHWAWAPAAEASNRRVARYSQWKGCFGGLEAEPPAAGGWGFGAKPPAAGGTGVWVAPSARKFYIFLQK